MVVCLFKLAKKLALFTSHTGLWSEFQRKQNVVASHMSHLQKADIMTVQNHHPLFLTPEQSAENPYFTPVSRPTEQFECLE